MYDVHVFSIYLKEHSINLFSVFESTVPLRIHGIDLVTLYIFL